MGIYKDGDSIFKGKTTGYNSDTNGDWLEKELEDWKTRELHVQQSFVEMEDLESNEQAADQTNLHFHLFGSHLPVEDPKNIKVEESHQQRDNCEIIAIHDKPVKLG